MKTGTKTVLLTINHVEIECTAHFDYVPPQKQTHDDPGHPAEIYITGLDIDDGKHTEDLSVLMVFEAVEETILCQIQED